MSTLTVVALGIKILCPPTCELENCVCVCLCVCMYVCDIHFLVCNVKIHLCLYLVIHKNSYFEN